MNMKTEIRFSSRISKPKWNESFVSFLTLFLKRSELSHFCGNVNANSQIFNKDTRWVSWKTSRVLVFKWLVQLQNWLTRSAFKNKCIESEKFSLSHNAAA